MMTKAAAIGFAFLGLGAAVVAAVYWWRASRVPIYQPVASISDVPEQFILNTQIAFNESSRLNSYAAIRTGVAAYAAIWTGVAAVLSAIASVLGVL